VTTLDGAGAPGAGAGAVRGTVLVGIGIDSVDLARMRRVLARRPGLAERLFTAGELTSASSRADPVPTLAGRFAAKEAVMKSLGVGLGSFDWRDLDIARRPGGQPALALAGRAAALARSRGVTRWELSITHTDTVASAVVAALA